MSGSTTRRSNNASLFESLESRQMLSAVPLGSKIKVAQLTDTNGNALNSSRITVRFSENITLADASKIRLFGYGLNPLSSNGTAQQKITINTLNVVEGADGNKIVFETDRRVRKGAKLTFYNGFVKNASDNSDTGDLTTELPKGLNKERFTLSARAFRPTDLSLFNQDLFSGAPAVTPTPNVPSEASVLADLTAFFNDKIAQGLLTSEQKTTALNQFNDVNNQSLVPAPNIRAGIVALVGTVAETAIDDLLGTDNVTGKKYTIIDFSTDVTGSATIAETKANPTTGRLRTLFKTTYRGEPFQVLSAMMAHEAVHQDIPDTVSPDLPDSINEEIFANTVETIVWAQHLMVDDSVASAGTQLVTERNASLLAMLNSGLALFPRVGLTDGPILGGNVFFGADPVTGGDYTSFDNYVRRLYTARNFQDTDTAANRLAREYQNAICARTDTTNFNFTDARNDLFDNSQQIITDREACALAHTLLAQITK